MTIGIIGHKNPDTDTVCAAIALSDLKNKLGEETKPYIQGDINPETRFVLEKFSLSAPESLSDAAGMDIYLVDHSDSSQSVDALKDVRIVGIVDHHKLGDITTSEPLEIWTWPVGSTCTIIKSMYDFYGIPIEPGVAGAMLSAILSDTVIFKSATATDKDRIAAEALAEMAGVTDTKALGMEMFKVKSEVDAPAKELLLRDYKDFDMSGNKVGIGQLEMVDLTMIDERRDELLDEMKKMKDEGRHSVFLLLTDIMKEASDMLYLSDDPSVIEKAFGVTPKDTSAWLEGVMSRKKQVVPPLEKAFGE